MNSPLTELGLLNPSLKECEDRAKILAKFAMCLFAKTCGKNPELNHPQAALHGMYDKVKKCLHAISWKKPNPVISQKNAAH